MVVPLELDPGHYDPKSPLYIEPEPTQEEMWRRQAEEARAKAARERARKGRIAAGFALIFDNE